MAKEKEGKFGEKAARLGRDINILIALGVAGVALAIPGPNVVLASYATWNGAQAGAWEGLRRWARKRNNAKLH